MQKFTPLVVIIVIAFFVILFSWFQKNQQTPTTAIPIASPIRVEQASGVSAEVIMVKSISKDLKIVSDATKEKFSGDDIYNAFSGIIDGSGFTEFYDNYTQQKDRVYDIIQGGNGDLFYAHGGTDTFIKLAYSCDIFRENMNTPDVYREILKKSLKLMFVTDENGANVGVYKDMNDVMLNFINTSLSLEEFLPAYIASMEKAKSTMNNELWKEYMDLYIGLYRRFQTALEQKNSPDCQTFLKDTFPIHLKEFDK